MSENKKTNQIQPPEELVLCGASAYNQKFYINENFKNLPDEIKNQLKVMCVLFVQISEESFSLFLTRREIWNSAPRAMRMIFYTMISEVD